MTALHSKTILADLWRAAGQPGDALDAVDLTGAEPVLPSSFAVGTLAQTTIAAAALAAGELWHLRTGRRQRISVAMRDAAIEFRSERYLQVNGKPTPEYTDPIHGIYRCRDGRWVRIHANFPHHRDGVLRLLGCEHDPAAVAQALAQWDAEAFEAAAAEAGLVATMSRSFAEWDAHPQGRAIAGLPLFTIERIGDAPPQPLPAGDRPLSGIRVLDLTRVIAGPVCGRTLAAHGADVLLVTARHLPKMEPLVIDNGRGKLSTAVDLRDADGRATPRRPAAATPTSSCRATGPAPLPPRLRPAGGGAHPPRHRLCLAVRLRPRRSVGGTPRLRFAGAECQRPQRRRGGGRRRRDAESRCRRRRSTMAPAT